MCFARTAALQGGFEKQKVNARRGFCSNPCAMSKKALKATEKTCFVDMCGMFRSLLNIAKTVVLLQEEHVCDACLLTSKIIDKGGCEGSKALPRPPKIESVATISSKKTTNMSLKSARSA